MLVQLISEFIENLKKEKQKNPFDDEFIASLSERFSNKLPDYTLNKDDFDFLLACYKTRWNKIYDDEENDFTLSPSIINQLWIDLAKKLEDETDVPYLKILMPTVTNSVDPHDGSKLTETETLTNFYIAYDGITLCRKRSLCDYILKHDGELATRKDLKTASVFTLDELSRLKRCTQVKGAFSIGDQQFTSFYDFIRKRPFANLTKRGEIPKDLLPQLLALIECYYNLKSKPENFAEFKNKTQVFFKCLYDYPLVNVNFLYGQRILAHERELYLVDILLAVFETKKFNLDHEMEILAEFLIKLYPGLKPKNKELILIYEKACLARIKTYKPCHSLLVSFYVTQFKIGMLTGVETITAWDIENRIPSELSATYKMLLDVCVSTQPTDFVKTYADIINNYIVPKIDESSSFTWFGRDEATNKWLTKVRDSLLAAIGGYWFEPEQILSVLSTFHIHTSNVKTKINCFLDGLIKTYSQAQDDFKKQLRVNILFSGLLSKLSEDQRKSLLELLAGCELKVAWEQFIPNCALHINKQLEHMGYSQYPESSPQYFSSPIKVDVSKDLSENVTNVIGLIDNYTNKLVLKHLKEDVQKKIRTYLFNLKDTILTVAEQDEASKGMHANPDPLGAFT